MDGKSVLGKLRANNNVGRLIIGYINVNYFYFIIIINFFIVGVH